jgi:3-dehydroquinate synthase
MHTTVSFPSGIVSFYTASAHEIDNIYKGRDVILLTDEHVAAAQPALFAHRKAIIIPAGEQYKNLQTVEYICMQLLRLEATRSSVLVGVGGGVITDIAGFVAATYMRGITFGFVPASVLAMVDAAIGGKNGVNIGLHKNITGTITQPHSLIFDISLLSTLPAAEWSNGFAEVIKYACLFDASLFGELAQHDVRYYMNNPAAMQQVIDTCVGWKNRVVVADEHEKGERKLLNFGHTAAHAIENLYDLPHGQAVAIGMMIAMKLSEEVMGMDGQHTAQLRTILQQYGLPVTYNIDVARAMDILEMDKKRAAGMIDYILLEDIGKAVIKPLPFDIIEKALSICS